jgi:hypothetical protein
MWLTLQRIRAIVNQVKGQPHTAVAEPARSYSSSVLRPEMPVMDHQGTALGRVAAFHHDGLSGRLTGLTVRHGVRGSKRTRVSVETMSSISQGMVILTYSKAEFMQLPPVDTPPAKDSNVGKS